jgi:hypothetical protein
MCQFQTRRWMTHGPNFVHHVRFINLIYMGINNKFSNFAHILIPFTTKFHQTRGTPWRTTSMAESNLKDHNRTIVWITRPWTVLCRCTHDCRTADGTQMNSHHTFPLIHRICSVACDGFMNPCKLHACLHHGDYISWNSTTQHLNFSLNFNSRMVTIRTRWFNALKSCPFLTVYLCVPQYSHKIKKWFLWTAVTDWSL